MAGARRFIVTGRVQGVYFRDSTRRVAESLDLTGHAINLPNGDVEVFACGSEAALDELQAWLHEGPALARVTAVRSEPAAVSDVADFRTG